MGKQKKASKAQTIQPSSAADVSLREGQVWRKAGPFDWLRVKTIMLPGTPGDDGGMPGVAFDTLSKHGKTKRGSGLFLPANKESDVLEWLENTGRSLAS